jgi:stage II sporulation protein E
MEKSKFQRWVQLQWAGLGRRIKQSGRMLTFENRFIQALFIKKWSILLVVMGFLLGRAMILEQLTPFAIAYFAVIYYLRRDIIHWMSVSLFLGSLFSIHQHTGSMVVGMLVFMFIQKGMEKYEHSDISYAPILVFITSLVVKVFSTLVAQELTWYLMMMITVEALLAFILTLIFIQAIPVFTLSRKNYSLKNEEIICLIILLASVMTGTVGWVVEGVSVEHVMSRYLILLFAFVGGAPLGASVGVVTGLILSLADAEAVYQMSLLAFAGMLAGLLREGKKMAVALGMLLGSSILSMYIGDQAMILSSTWESVAAVILFLLTPRITIQTIAKYVPGTQENIKSQHDYAKRIRTMIAERVQQFSEVFNQLAFSFTNTGQAGADEKRQEEVGHFMNAVAHKSCATCWKNKQCWDDKFHRTYKYMTEMMTEIEGNAKLGKKDIPLDWRQACVKPEKVMDVMKLEYEKYKYDMHWKRQIQDSKQLVSDQLSGVSQVMGDLANEIKREGQEMFQQEEQIRYALEELGLSIHSIEIICLDEGNVEIEMIHQYSKGYDECKKIIAPLLSDILGENIAVRKEQFIHKGEGYCTVNFASAKEYEVSTGMAGAAKGGELLSGDSFSTIELGNGKFAVAISDGMGNGERANAESKTALTILHQLLQSGMNEKLAIKSVNSILLLRSSDEMFATIDVALIDLYNAQTTFLKIGSTPSFIKRGAEVITVSANNLPVGILQEIDVDLIRVQLLPGDTLIMMTDGIYDAPGHAVNKELWMKRIIQEMHVTEPQDIADCLLETIVRGSQGAIPDDMTVVVAKIEKHCPEWATFRWPNAVRMERPKTVS